MAFFGGAIVGKAKLDTKGWQSGVKSIIKGSALMGAAVLAGVGAAMWKATKAANDYQIELKNVSTLTDEATVSTKELSKTILLGLDPALGSATEITKGFYQAFSAGAETMEEATQVTVDSAKFAKAALTDTLTAVDVLTTATNAYGKETMSTTRASDVFFTTIKKGKITGEELAGTIGQSIPLFASAGISLEELGSGMAAMTKQGVSASESTTQLNAIVNSFLKPSGKMTKQLKEMGFESGAAFLEAEGLAGALDLIQESTDGDATAIAELLPNIRAMRGAMALTGEGGKIFTDTMEEMETATGATDKAFAKQEKTFETFKNQLGKTQILVGNIGKAFVDKLAAGATKALKAFNAFLASGKAAEKLGDVIGIIAGGFAAMKTIVQPIVDSIGPGIKSIFDEMATAGDTLSGKTAEGAGVFKIFAGASKLVAIGITIFAKATTGAIKNISNLVRAVMDSAGVLSGFFQALTGKIKWDEYNERVAEAGDSIKKLGTDLVVTTVDLVGSTFKEFENFGEATDKLALEAKTKFEVTTEVTKKFITNTYSSMLLGAKDATGEIVDAGTGAAAALGDIAKSSAEKWSEAWGTAMSETLPKVKGYYDQIAEIASFGMGQLNDITSQGLVNEKAEMELSFGKREAALKESLQTGLLTQEEFDQQKKALDDQKRKEANEISKKQFDNEKQARTGDVGINAASAIMGWWETASTMGPIAGPIFGGAMTAATLGLAGAQIASIQGQKFVPQFERGGETRFEGPLGVAQVNEKGGELMILPDGTTIVPNDISMNLSKNAGGNNQNINVVINNPQVNDEKMLNKLVNRISAILGKKMRLQT